MLPTNNDRAHFRRPPSSPRHQRNRPVVADLVNLVPQPPVNNQSVPVASATLLSDDDLSRRVIESDRTIERLNHALISKRRENQNLFTHIQELQGTISSLQRRISILYQLSENSRNHLEGRINKLQKQVRGLTQENAALKTENKALKEKLKKD